MSETSRIFTLRSRPIAYQPGRWGGALVAVERGFFPVSGTGYRSLSGLHGTDEGDATTITPEFLKALAVNQDRERRSVLARVLRPPTPGRDALTNYVSVSLDADKALAEGFFAPDAERVALWGGAYRLLCLIDADPRFQPSPHAPAWTPAHCAETLARHRAALAFVRQLATGDFPTAPSPHCLCAAAYFELPPKPAGESGFALPALPTALPLDLPSAPAGDHAPGHRPTRAIPSRRETADDATQLSLF